MIILDTDCLTLLERQTGIPYRRLQAKLDEFPADDITTTIITFEEQMRGWMSYLARMRSIEEQPQTIFRLLQDAYDNRF
ncbi:MAG: hypothetical protein AB7F88_17170 [Pyrinomonadaceae bacterium]